VTYEGNCVSGGIYLFSCCSNTTRGPVRFAWGVHGARVSRGMLGCRSQQYQESWVRCEIFLMNEVLRVPPLFIKSHIK